MANFITFVREAAEDNLKEETMGQVEEQRGVTPTAVRIAKSRVLRRLKEQFGELIP